MMFHATMREAVEAARTLAQADDLSRRIWQAHASGAVTDDQAQSLAEVLHARRSAIREAVAPVCVPLGRVTLFPPRRLQRTPERAEAIARRRLLACSGPMPPALAARFTTGQLAVLKIVGEEVARHGTCGLCVDAIAARAGVCRRLAQGAIRLAEGDGLLVVTERRHQGRKNDTNVVRILSREWLAWLRRGRGAPRFGVEGGHQREAPMGVGCKPLHPTDKGITSRTARPREPSKSCRGAAGALDQFAQPRIGAAGGASRAMR